MKFEIHGFGTLLFLIFLILKLTGVIAWSWWWVTSPLWLPIAIVLLFLSIVFIGKGIIMLMERK